MQRQHDTLSFLRSNHRDRLFSTVEQMRRKSLRDSHPEHSYDTSTIAVICENSAATGLVTELLRGSGSGLEMSTSKKQKQG